MTFTISYRMIVGLGERTALNAREALAAYREIKQAGGSEIIIREGGRFVALDELIILALKSR